MDNRKSDPTKDPEFERVLGNLLKMKLGKRGRKRAKRSVSAKRKSA